MNAMATLSRCIGYGLLALVYFSSETELAAEQRFTEQNPKYQQRPKTNSLEGITTLEAGVIAAFKKFVSKSNESPRATVVIDDHNLPLASGSDEISGLHISRDLEADLQQMLRAAGMVVLDTDSGSSRCVRIDVRLNARQIPINEFNSVQNHWIPDIQVTAKMPDGRIVAQANTLNFLGRDAQAFRLFERVGTQNLIRALGIMLLYDFANNNVVEIPFSTLDPMIQEAADLSQPEYRKATNSVTNSTPNRLKSNQDKTPAPNQSAQTDSGASLLAARDRERVLKQVIESLKQG